MESYDEFDKKPAIIIDNGSCFIKSGLSYEDSPKSCLRAFVGYPKNKDIFIKDIFIGKQMKGRMNAFNLHYPIKKGSIQNWDEMEKIWPCIFDKELEVILSEHNIILI